MNPADLHLYSAVAVAAAPWVTDRVLAGRGRHRRHTMHNPRGSLVDLRPRHALHPPRRG